MAQKLEPQPLSRVSKPRLYEQLVAQLLSYIESAHLGPGDLLPAERDLAERLGVSRATLAQALVALEVLGVIDVQHGTGAVLVYRPSIATVIKGLRDHRNRLRPSHHVASEHPHTSRHFAARLQSLRRLR